MIGFIRFKTCFSYNLKKIRTLTDWFIRWKKVWRLSVLRIRIIIEHFHCVRKYDRLIVALKVFVNITIVF